MNLRFFHPIAWLAALAVLIAWPLLFDPEAALRSIFLGDAREEWPSRKQGKPEHNHGGLVTGRPCPACDNLACCDGQPAVKEPTTAEWASAKKGGQA